MKVLALLLPSASLAFAASLPSVGPDYARPEISPPEANRDAPVSAPGAWKTGEPADALARGEWWKLFGDDTLNALESEALTANQDLHAAAARVEQARAAAGLARANNWPQVAVDGSVTRERTSSTTDNVFPNTLTTTYRAPLVASWELDLFGRVRRLTEGARAEAAATEANFESVRLALTAEVATSYFSLRALEQELGIVHETIALRRRAYELVTARLRSGTAADLDAARAENELASTEVEASVLSNRRAAERNALAVLVGRPATDFEVATPANVTLDQTGVPAVPAGLPSGLLERRPDIAAAERSLAAANARIGVAKAAFFPAISLTGGAGYASGDIDGLFRADSRAWSIGPSLYLPIFQGGRNRANLARSRAAYEEAVAVFRQRVLIAFREVQDALTASRYLTEQSGAQERALSSAQRATVLAQRRYDAGYVSYLEVIDAQRTALSNQRASVQLTAQRLNTSIALIKALGGGWSSTTAGARLTAR
jgi:multidrug efflux system outer membrane protein